MSDLEIKTAEFYFEGQKVKPKVNIRTIEPKFFRGLSEGDIKDTDLPPRSKGGKINTPFDFILMKNGREFDRFFMEKGTNKTTLREVADWLSYKFLSPWDTLTFFFDEYGTTKELLRNEKYPQSELLDTPIFDFLCSENAIPVNIHNYGMKRDKRSIK